MKLTLRKGIVEKKLGIGAYYAKDTFNGNKVLVSLSGRERLNNIELEIGATIYIIVSPLDFCKGKLFTVENIKGISYEGNLLLDKEILDRGEDPQQLDS